MPGDVEREVLLQLVDGGEVALLARLGELLEGRVGAGDVGGVVLVVMQLEQPGRVVRLERRVVVGQVGKRVAVIHRALLDLSMRHRRNNFCGINNKGGVGLRTREKESEVLGEREAFGNRTSANTHRGGSAQTGRRHRNSPR